MKLKKLLVLFVIAIAAVSCKNDDDGGGNAFLLNSENLAGTYDIILLEDVEEETFLVNEVPINSVITTVGDTFQIDFIMTSNNTFTISG
ncbi:MAG: hypothetical protein K0U54_02060, partial [Bacteroidetes bacterium]|nr:hypothetical protein [Bacteroidota bacterium]